MARSKSSTKWLQEHHKDPFVKASRLDGYRSRASYKLLELDERDRLLKSGMSVIDLGAAPGGWSQVAAQKVGVKGQVIASDILMMDSLADVTFIQGDFTQDAVFEEIITALNGHSVDLVISDMAPNFSGIVDVDQPASMHLVELAFDLAQRVLRQDGVFVTKIFQGEGFDAFFKLCRTHFKTVLTRKPTASRPRSREVYLVAKGFK